MIIRGHIGGAARGCELLYVFGFEKVGVVLSDLYFVDPDPKPGQEGAERGIRLEVRLLSELPIDGSIYAAHPILINEPIWRADLLETVEGPPGSFDRTHHHPHFAGFEPDTRVFVKELSASPFAWVGKTLENLGALVVEAGLPLAAIGEHDEEDVRSAVPEIVNTLESVMARIHAGDLAQQPVDVDLTSVRTGWL